MDAFAGVSSIMEQFTVSLIMHINVSLKLRSETLFGFASQGDISVYKGYIEVLFQED